MISDCQQDGMGCVGRDALAGRPLLVGPEGSASGPQGAADVPIKHPRTTHMDLLCVRD